MSAHSGLDKYARDTSGTTHVRVSRATKKRLEELVNELRHRRHSRFATADDAIAAALGTMDGDELAGRLATVNTRSAVNTPAGGPE